MNMAEENSSTSASDTGREVPADSSPTPGKSYTPAAQRKRRRNLVILVVAVVLVASGLFLWRYFSSYESTDDAQGSNQGNFRKIIVVKTRYVLLMSAGDGFLRLHHFNRICDACAKAIA